MALVAMLGIFIVQSRRLSGAVTAASDAALQKGIRGFAVIFTALLGASLVGILTARASEPVSWGVLPGAGADSIAAYSRQALFLFVLTSLPPSLVYLYSLVTDTLGQE